MRKEYQIYSTDDKLGHPQRQRRRPWHERLWLNLKKAPFTAWFGMIVTSFYIVIAIGAPLIAPFGETEIFSVSFSPWDNTHILGTDQIGRDILSRLIYGARNTMGLALVTTTLSFVIGGFWGLLAAIMGRWLDQIISRFVDVLMAIPSLIFALMLLAVLGSTPMNLILIIALLDSTRVFRLTRAVSMNVVVTDYVEVARLRGEGFGWVMRREILPNIMPTLIAEFGLRFSFVFLTLTALSYLGLGIQPPTADWGSMVRDTSSLIQFAQYDINSALTPLLPAGTIALLVIAINFVVDWVLQKTSGLHDDQ
ncbi:ABC transporter permease [Candidatus Endowatersipora endosymbiont of Watersipora subatra]|uniref:ABC transporter permease n=1 Tax=Candidatus Endowatersipora endosymbiont of Watersipora subatra TaxID=3077946 RepID=UPI00312C9D06